MSTITEDKQIIIEPDGVAEYCVDRVMNMPDGAQRRMKVLRQQGPASVLFEEGNQPMVLPRDCRVFQSGGDRTVFVIEQVPQVRTIGWEWKCREGWYDMTRRGCMEKYGLTERDLGRRRFSFAFPYTVFFIEFRGGLYHSTRMFYRKDPIRSLDDVLYFPGITNYRSNFQTDYYGVVCMGRGWTTANLPRRSEAAARLDEFTTHFWTSPFNDHWTENFTCAQSRVPELLTPWDWEFHSKRDPYWVLRANWEPSDYSIGTFLTHLCQVPDVRTGGFQTLVNAIQKGPKWSQRQPLDADQGFAKSLSLALLVNRVMLETKQKLVCTQSGCGCVAGQTYAIEYFCEADSRGRRALKFKEMEHPVKIDEYWWNYFQVDKVGASTSVLDRFPLTIGSLVYFSSVEMFEGYDRNVRYQVKEMQVDVDGDLLVRFSNQGDCWVYLTHDGGELHEAVAILIPRLENGTFSYGDLSISVGQIIRARGGDLYREYNHQLLKVASIVRKDASSFHIQFEGKSGDEVLFTSDREFWFKWDLVGYQYSEQFVALDGQRLDLNDGTLLVTGEYEWLRSGEVYHGAKFIRSTAEQAHPFDVDLVFAYGNQPISIIRKSKFVENIPIVPAALEWNNGSVYLKSGMKVRVSSGSLRDGIYEILCFVPHRHLKEYVDIVLDNGRSLTICQQLLKSFVVLDPVTKEEWLKPEQYASLPDIPTKDFIIPGFAVLQTQIDSIPASHVGKVFHIHDSYYDSYWGCTVLDVSLPSVEKQFKRIPRDRFFYPTILDKRFSDVRVLRSQEGGWILLSDVPEVLLQEAEKLPSADIHVGNDSSRNPVKIGDLVRVKQISWDQNWGTNKLRSCAKGALALVVHRGQCGGDGKPFGYLLFAEKGMFGNQWVGRDTYGYQAFDNRFKQDAYCSLIGLNLFEDCQRLDIDDGQDALVPEISIDTYVCVRSGITPHYGWGGVSPQDIGQVREIEGEDALVAFPHIPEWVARVTDLEVALYAVGQRVMLKFNVVPFYGRGQVGKKDVGVVRKHLPDGVVLVEFPSHKNWYGLLSELQLVK